MRTTDYNVGSVVTLSDGKKYMYLGYREICGSKSHDYEPLEGKSPFFGTARDEEGNAFVPFVGKAKAEVIAEIVDTPKRKGLMRRALDWWKASNRWKHFLYAIPSGVVFGGEFTAGLALGMEVKDKLWGGKPDFIDYILTCLGGLIGWCAMRLFGLDYLVMELVKLVI